MTKQFTGGAPATSSGRDKTISLPTTLPLFPLRGALLLPRGRLPLNIFEPRYLAMTDHALAKGRIIGMARPREDSSTSLYDIGCAGRITNFMETEDGRYLITLSGISRFRIINETSDNEPFRVAEVAWEEFTRDLWADEENDTPKTRETLLELMIDYLEEVGLKADWESIEDASAQTIVTSIAMSCPFAPDEKQAILEAETFNHRADTLIALMEMALATSRTENNDVAKTTRLQ